MNADRKAEGRGQAFGAVVPASASIGRAPYAVVVLLVKHVARPWRTHHVVDAVPDVTIAWRGRVVAQTGCFGVRQVVAALPCRAAILGREDTGRRDSNPELFGVARIGNDRVQHQPGSTGVPASGGGVIRQSRDPRPILTAVLTCEKVRRFGAGIQRTVRVAERPDLSEFVRKRQRFASPADHLCEIGIVGGPIVHLPLGETGDLPTGAAVLAAPDTCAVPFAAAARPKGAGIRVSNHVIDGPAVTVGTVNGPVAAVIAAGNQKRALCC